MEKWEIGRETKGDLNLVDLKTESLLQLLREVVDEDDRDHTPIRGGMCYSCIVTWPCATERAMRLIIKCLPEL